LALPPRVFYSNAIITRGMPMQNPAKFREYAEECRKLAAMAKPDHKEKLLEIAKAWEECAREVEQRSHRR
jgi:hypothetical protein